MMMHVLFIQFYSSQITDTVEPIKRRGGVSDLEKIHFEEVNHKGATTTTANDKNNTLLFG